MFSPGVSKYLAQRNCYPLTVNARGSCWAREKARVNQMYQPLSMCPTSPLISLEATH